MRDGADRNHVDPGFGYGPCVAKRNAARRYSSHESLIRAPGPNQPDTLDVTAFRAENMMLRGSPDQALALARETRTAVAEVVGTEHFKVGNLDELLARIQAAIAEAGG